MGEFKKKHSFPELFREKKLIWLNFFDAPNPEQAPEIRSLMGLLPQPLNIVGVKIAVLFQFFTSVEGT